MHYYRHGETVFASLLPDLPLEAADRPTSGSPGLFLIDRDPVSGRSSFCVSDARQLTAGTEDVSWLDPARMGVPAPVLPKRIQHTIDARLLRAVNIRHPRWTDFAAAPGIQPPGRLRGSSTTASSHFCKSAWYRSFHSAGQPRDCSGKGTTATSRTHGYCSRSAAASSPARMSVPIAIPQ